MFLCCADRDKEEEDLQSSNGTRASAEDRIYVTLSRASQDDQLGISYDAKDPTAIRVTEVHPDSLISHWNAANPSMAIKVDDRIISVNGLKGNVDKLVDRLKKENELELVVCRQAMKVDILNGAWRSKDNEKISIQKGKIKWASKSPTWTLKPQGANKIVGINGKGDKFWATVQMDGDEIRWDDNDVWRRDIQEFLSDNTVLKAQSDGMAYRNKMDLEDPGARMDKEEHGFAKWGEPVMGRDLRGPNEEMGWVVVDEKKYLPTHVHGVQVLILQGPSPAEIAKAVSETQATAKAAPLSPGPPPTLPSLAESELPKAEPRLAPR
jgi:hypothetical protein